VTIAIPARSRVIAFVAIAMLALAPAADGARPATSAPESSIDRALVDRLLQLDPERIGARDVTEVLEHFRAPRIILLEGSPAIVNMEPFAQFLIAMGYPETRIGIPGADVHSTSSHLDSRQLAGMLAWFYEHERVRPLLIGHSRGGMLVIRVLYDLAGAFGSEIPVWNPLTDVAEDRTAFIDPRTGESRPVIGLRIPYAAAIGTGKLPRLLLGQWTMLSKLRNIPDTVEEFTGFSIEWDFIAGEFGSVEPYAPTGQALVRTVVLPASYTHIGLPQTANLAQNPLTRAWIEAYVPGASAPIPQAAGVETTNLIHAADIWHSVKKHWCLSAREQVSALQETK